MPGIFDFLGNDRRFFLKRGAKLSGTFVKKQTLCRVAPGRKVGSVCVAYFDAATCVDDLLRVKAQETFEVLHGLVYHKTAFVIVEGVL